MPYDSSAGRELTVGEPVRGDRRAVRQQFLGHDVAVQMTEPVAAVLGRDGQADEARVAEAGGEVRVPARQPGVDGGLPAELGAVGGQELPDRPPAVRPAPASLAHSASNSLTGHDTSER